MERKFAIIGAGIGGLTLAIALQRKGFSVTVYEQSSTIRPVGAGLMLAANAIKAFSEIGIAEEVLTAGKVLKRVLIRDSRGRVLMETNSEKISARYGLVNNVTIHRADLHRVLLEQLAPGTVITGKSCVDFMQTAAGAILYFQDGSSVLAQNVIAADGIHSIFRRELVPGSEPRYAGYTCWRGVTDNVPPDFNFDETFESWGPGCRFGAAPLTDGRVYWFACMNARQNDPVLKTFRIPDLLACFSTFHSPVSDLLKGTRNEDVIWGDIIDLKPLSRFAFGNIVLMGDAAHATTPNMGQGACMAIEDAAVLANAMEHYSTVAEAFEQFDRKRILRTTRIVNGSWNLGKAAQLENPLLIGLRNALVRCTPASVAEKQVKFLFDVSFV